MKNKKWDSIKKELNENIIKNTMYYLNLNSNTNTNISHGIIVATISMIMALKSYDFYQACNFIKPYLPKNININAIPESWKRELLN